MTKGEFCRIHFRVYAPVSFGQTIGIFGNSSTLGHFNKDLIVPLVTTPQSYPIWYTDHPIVVPKDDSAQEIEYNYVIIENGVCKAVEEREHRKCATNKTDVVVEDSFTNPPSATSTAIPSAATSTVDIPSLSEAVEVKLNCEDDEVKNDIYFICYHLPLSVKRSANHTEAAPSYDIKWSDSIISKTEENSVTMNKHWVGTLSIPGEPLTAHEEEVLRARLKAMNCIPIFLSTELTNDCYYGYCKQLLWPLFHNVELLDATQTAWNQGVDENSVREKWDSSKFTKWLQAYRDVTKLFADCLHQFIKPGDILWIHDYHLALLPGKIRKFEINVKIIFYLHIPFPTSQIFRSLPYGQEIVQSITEADVVGFHAFDHSRHFVQSARRLLGYRSRSLQGGLLAVDALQHQLVISLSNVGVEAKELDVLMQSDEALMELGSVKNRHAGKKVIVAIESCQRLTGGDLKVEAFKMFLQDLEKEGLSKYVMVFKAIRPANRLADEALTSNELRQMVNQLNEKYSAFSNGPVIDYEELPSISKSRRVGLYLAADVFLNSSIREGLNLYPLEYIYCRQNQTSGGVVIVSEFSVCASVLNGAIKINPFNVRSTADTIAKALSMTPDECHSRSERDRQFLSTRNSGRWANQVLKDLRSQMKINANDIKSRRTCEINPVRPADVVDAYTRSVSVPSLKDVGNRVFIFDYGGTLITKERYNIYLKQNLNAIAGRSPTPELMAAIRKLASDRNNVVAVMSGLTREKLGGIFDDIPNLTIATSNGVVYSWGVGLLWDTDIIPEAEEDGVPSCIVSVSSEDGENEENGDKFTSKKPNLTCNTNLQAKQPSTLTPTSGRGNSRSNQSHLPLDSQIAIDGTFDDSLSIKRSSSVVAIDREWICMHDEVNWQEVNQRVIPIMAKYTARTNGSYISPRIPGISWSYFAAEPDYGEKQAQRLKTELEAALINYDVKVSAAIQGSLEIVPRILDKGVFVTTLLHRVCSMRAGKLPSFIMVAGDEPPDDRMFEATYRHVGQCGAQDISDVTSVFTVHVGRAEEHQASTFVEDVSKMEELLTQLSRATNI